MKKPCKIEVKSVRRLSVPDFLKETDSSVEEKWEDMLWEEGFSPEDMHPSDRWTEEDESTAPTTFTAEGILSREEDGSLRITYEDSEITGLEGCLTTFCYSPSGMLILLRQGAVKTCMAFEENTRHLCDYGARGGISTVFLHTHGLKVSITDDGGRFFVEYSVEMGGVRTERNALDISFQKI